MCLINFWPQRYHIRTLPCFGLTKSTFLGFISVQGPLSRPEGRVVSMTQVLSVLDRKYCLFSQGESIYFCWAFINFPEGFYPFKHVVGLRVSSGILWCLQVTPSCHLYQEVIVKQFKKSYLLGTKLYILYISYIHMCVYTHTYIDRY